MAIYEKFHEIHEAEESIPPSNDINDSSVECPDNVEEGMLVNYENKSLLNSNVNHRYTLMDGGVLVNKETDLITTTNASTTSTTTSNANSTDGNNSTSST